MTHPKARRSHIRRTLSTVCRYLIELVRTLLEDPENALMLLHVVEVLFHLLVG